MDPQCPQPHYGCNVVVAWPARHWQSSRYTSAFGLTGGYVWITYLLQLKSEVLHSSSRDWVYCV